MEKLDLPSMASRSDPDTSFSQPSKADMARMSEVHVRFDGHCYRYGQYCYDKLADALAYAKLDQSRPGHQTMGDGAPVWTPPLTLTMEQRSLMDSLGVEYDGRQYRFKGYHYDRLADAIAYARQNA
jgi:hypothetical protein